MTSSQYSESPAESRFVFPEPPREHTLTDVGGFDALHADLDLLSRQEGTPECDINPNAFPPAFKAHCQSIWYYFNDEIDQARDTIDHEHYWCLEATMLLSHWIDKRPAVDRMSELPSLWCPSAAEGWQALAVSLRNKLLEKGMSGDEFRELRLRCKHRAYYEIEYRHLQPMSTIIEGRHWLGQDQPKQSVLDSQTLQHGLGPESGEVETAPVLAMSPKQPTRRSRNSPPQQDEHVSRRTMTTRSQSRKQDQSKRTLRSGKELNLLHERSSSDSDSKATRKSRIGNTRVIGGKVDSKSRCTDGTRKRRAK
ncbi:Uu.00g136190.m01.CDS01 [Anthostomella pinea]|uniref:Uu.00g136190.m01.CDS01 n=1 Tax=Anthostomella pinea TaxID=933095 RepID=A0AAI8VQ15_9PEZI|nr:Uu.00g136190.m01.CDS01 [Anthostomella pinea]